jgi:hypothetical protein
MWFIPLIERFGVAELAAQLALPPKNIRRWVDLDSIPAEWFAPISRAAKARGLIEIDLEYLADRAEARRLHRSALKRDVQTEAA